MGTRATLNNSEISYPFFKNENFQKMKIFLPRVFTIFRTPTQYLYVNIGVKKGGAMGLQPQNAP